MRINIYAEELTQRTEIVTKRTNTGNTFHGARVYLHSPTELHHTERDDDSSAITFWIPWTQKGGHEFEYVIKTLRSMISNIQTLRDRTTQGICVEEPSLSLEEEQDRELFRIAQKLSLPWPSTIEDICNAITKLRSHVAGNSY